MVFAHQPSIPALKLDRRFSFGGPLLKGNARKARPVSKNFPILVAFESSNNGGFSSLMANERWILSLARRLAKHFQIEIYSIRISSGKDLQILIKVKKRAQLSNFFRSLAGLIPRKILEKRVQRRHAWKSGYWKQRPFTWILNWNELFKSVLRDLSKRKTLVLVSENAYGHSRSLNIGGDPNLGAAAPPGRKGKTFVRDS